MPRSPRIEYSNAFYHVMNRGRGRQDIFHDKRYFEIFLKVIQESFEKFDMVIHAYCLMSNHYHLILETPNANLSRVMRHINGVYTQRYNKLRETDGPLFRGRFKAILMEEETYLLNLSRYIHRNPIKFVKKLEDYKWSSYPSYLNLVQSPKWLNKVKTMEFFDGLKNIKHYKDYVLKEFDQDNIKEIYSDKSFDVMGSDDFKKRIQSKVIDDQYHTNKDQLLRSCRNKLSIDDMIKKIANCFDVSIESIIGRQGGRPRKNFPRKLAMYLCYIYLDMTFAEIANYFALSSSGGVSKAIFCVKHEIMDGRKYQEQLRLINKDLWFMEVT